jgi:hypothetical protein
MARIPTAKAAIFPAFTFCSSDGLRCI